MKDTKPEESATRGKQKRNKTSNVKVNSEIKILCDKGNGPGLIRYIISNIKYAQTLRRELKVALSNAPDAANLALKALEGYNFSDDSNRRACILLLESLFSIFGDDDNAVVPSDVKNSAREIAKAWREGMNTNCGLDSQAFLQLLVSFRIAADYEKDELLGILFPMSSQKLAPELCRSLGLTPDVDFLNKVSNNHGQLDALRFAHAFGMMDKVHSVGLLASHLRDVDEDIAKGLLTRAHGLDASKPQNQIFKVWRDANFKKIGVLRNVIHLVHIYGLQCNSFKANLQKELINLEQEKVDGLKVVRDGRKKASEEKAKQKGEKTDEKKAQEKENGEKAADEEKAQTKEDGEKDSEKKAQEKENGEKAAEKKAQAKEDGMKADEKKAEAKKYRRKAAEKDAQEKEDGNRAVEKTAQEKEDGKKAAEKKAQEKEDGNKAAEKKAQEKGTREKAAEKKAQAKEDGTKPAEKKAQLKKYREKAAEKEAQEKEDEKKADEKKAQHKRHKSFEPGYGLSKKGNYASKRAKHASLNEKARVAGGMDNSKASPYNFDRVQNKSGIIGHDHYPSAFRAANRSFTGIAAGAFTVAPSIAATIHDARRGYEGYPSAFGTSNLTPVGSSLYSSGAFTSAPSSAALIHDVRRGHERYPSAIGTSNITPLGSSLYSSGVPAGAFAVPLSNVAEVNYEGRGQQSYNFGGVDKYHVRVSSYGTVDLAKSSATESSYNFEGRGQQNYKLNFGEIDNNSVKASANSTGILSNSSATQCHYERSVPELYTSTFGGELTNNSIESSLYGSFPPTISSSDVNQGSYERSLGQYSGFAGRNMVPLVSSGYGSGVSTVPPSNVTEGHFERKGSVIDKYQFNSGYTSSLPPAN